jgi:guanosine-3',5'-bis(diphosphate) 3'-pyrophosphohydrolase
VTFDEAYVDLLMKAFLFSARKHRRQRRKDWEFSPYINHPIEVAELLWRVGGVRRVDVLLAAILHDTVEDTSTSPQEIEDVFGSGVCGIVMEVTDDKNLPKDMRKALQIEHAPHLSEGAKLVKLGDKICNVVDLYRSPPITWTRGRRKEYLDWSEKVVNGLKGVNQTLEEYYVFVHAQAEAGL